MSFDIHYKKLIKRCLEDGELRQTRGEPAYSVLGVSIEHDMSLGFPATTLRKLPFRSMAVETEFYLRGLTDKNWLKERGCNFWNYWSSPLSDDENDLGPTYGFEWRNWGQEYSKEKNTKTIDQLKELIVKIKNNPDSKRLLVTQWNPTNLDYCAIPACPFAFQILKYGDRLNMIFYQRSVDISLGLPNDFAQHALLLELICNQTGYSAGKVIGMFGQAELYKSHVGNIKKMLKRDILPYPKLNLLGKQDLDNFDYRKVSLKNYQHGKSLKFNISI